MPIVNDENLQSVAANTAWAAEVFSKYGDFIMAVIRSKIGDDDLASDLYQNYFLVLIAYPIPRDVKNIKTYIYKTVTNDVLDAIRHLDRYQSYIKRFSKIVENPINNDTPESALIYKETMEKTFQMIEELLPAKQSQAITLKFKDNKSIGKIAKRLKLNKRSVSQYISVGIKKMRQFLSAKEEA